MKMLCTVKLSPHRYKTPQGYLYCKDAIIARTGPQTYLKSEIIEGSDSDEYIDVDRKPEQVFDEKTMASFEGAPLTIEHPSESVNPENYKDLSVGHVQNIRRGKYDNQDVMLADIIVNDAEAINLIESGEMVELSCGYDCDITTGDNPEQINIRGNHVALCEQGRAGIARIQDSWKHPINDDLFNYDKAVYQDIFDTLISGTNADVEYNIRKVLNKYKMSLDSMSKDPNHIKFNWHIDDYKGVSDINLTKDLFKDDLIRVAEDLAHAVYKTKKSGVNDSVSKGTLIQEFGKQGKQYKIQKIVGNVIYAEELVSKKNVLFKCDEENVEWAPISKSEVKDSMYDRPYVIMSFAYSRGRWFEVGGGYELEEAEQEYEAYLNSCKRTNESTSFPQEYIVELIENSSGEEEVIKSAKVTKKGRIIKDSKKSNINDVKRGKELEYEDDLCVLYKNGEIIDKNIFDYIFSNHNYFYDNYVWDEKEGCYIFKYKKDVYKLVVLDLDNINDSLDNKIKDNYTGVLPKERRYRYRNYVIIDAGYSSAPYSIEGLEIAKEFKTLDEAKEYIRKNLSDSVPTQYVIALEDNNSWLDENDKPTDNIELAKKFNSLEEANAHKKLYCKGNVIKLGDSMEENSFNAEKEVGKIERLLRNINHGDIDVSYDSITVDFEDKKDLIEAGNKLVKLYDIELYDEDEDELYIAIYDKLEKPTKGIFITEDSNTFKGYDLLRGPASKEFKSYLRDRGLYFEPSENGRYVHFEVKNADKFVDQRVEDIRNHWRNTQDSFSRKFYVKAIKALEDKMSKLRRNELLDQNQKDYEIQKNKLKKTIRKQINEYKNKLNEK